MHNIILEKYQTSISEQLSLFDCPQHHYLKPTSEGYFSINFLGNKDRLQQQMYPVNQMPWVLDQHAKEARLYDQDFYASMATFFVKKRRAALMRDISVIWLDFDFYKIDQFSNYTPDAFATMIERVIADSDLPASSFTMSSGRGVYVNWILDKPLPHLALPRWQAVIRSLAKRFEAFGADPKACLPTQIMRVNGSVNMRIPQWYDKAERTVHVINARTDGQGNALTYDFDYLAEHILPYSREEVAAWRQQTHGQKWQNYAQNEQARLDYLASIRKGPAAEIDPKIRPIIADHDAARLWWGRVAALRSIAQSRGGIQDGEGRNDWCWILVNGMAWCSSKALLRFDASVLISEVIPTYTLSQIQRSGAAVAARVNAKQPLYAMKTSTLCDQLNITYDELARHWPNARAVINQGVMDFDPMKNLSFDEYLVETKRRQSLSAERTNTIQRLEYRDQRKEAQIMRSEGDSIRAIALKLGVSKSAVGKWLKK